MSEPFRVLVIKACFCVKRKKIMLQVTELNKKTRQLIVFASPMGKDKAFLDKRLKKKYFLAKKPLIDK